MLPIEVAGYRVEAHEVENARYTAPVWFVHGLWTDAWIWRAFGSFFAHRGWESLALSLRGRPESLAASIARVQLADWADDVVTVLSERGGPAPILVGHGAGALACLAAAERVSCRAVVALAPPFVSAMRPAFREALARRSGFFRSRVPVPAIAAGESVEPERLIEDSARIARAVLGGEIEPARAERPVLVVAGREDPWLDPSELEKAAEACGFAFSVRPAGHWHLAGKGFERHADPVHRWLVRELGGNLLKLTGFEDLDEEEEP